MNLPPVRIWPIYREDYGAQYGEKRITIDYKGKLILDIGADVGSTADFFLRRGAREVICVECNRDYFNELAKNAIKIKGIRPVFLRISEPLHFKNLIISLRPDVLKSDCEGCEKHLLKVSDDVFSLVKEYVVETHGQAIEKGLLEKLGKNGFKVLDVNRWCRDASIIYALKT